MIYVKNTENNHILAFDKEDDLIKSGITNFKTMTSTEIEEHIKSNISNNDILQIVKSEIRLTRVGVLNAVTGIGMRAIVSGDSHLAQESAVVSKLLLDITDDPALNAAKTYDDMRAAGMAAYRRIADSVSPDLRIAFKELER